MNFLRSAANHLSETKHETDNTKLKITMKKQLILLATLILLSGTVKILSQPIVGQAAPSLPEIKTLNNGFPDMKNKYLFIDFWATWCAPEIISLPHINTLADRFKNRIIFMAISDENEEQVRSFIQDKQWNNIFFGVDNNLVLHKNFVVKDLPVYYLISPDNIILSTGVSSDVVDYKLDSIVNVNDSIRLIKSVKTVSLTKINKKTGSHPIVNVSKKKRLNA